MWDTIKTIVTAKAPVVKSWQMTVIYSLAHITLEEVDLWIWNLQTQIQQCSNPNPNPPLWKSSNPIQIQNHRIWQKLLNPDLNPNPDLDLPTIAPKASNLTWWVISQKLAVSHLIMVRFSKFKIWHTQERKARCTRWRHAREWWYYAWIDPVSLACDVILRSDVFLATIWMKCHLLLIFSSSSSITSIVSMG